jgi:L-rhamnose mutarotase
MVIFKLKKGKVGEFKEWAEVLKTELYDEAIASLAEENCTHEIFELFQVNDEFYIVAHMEGENILPSNPEKEINIRHREVMKECIEKKIETETLYDFKA